MPSDGAAALIRRRAVPRLFPRRKAGRVYFLSVLFVVCQVLCFPPSIRSEEIGGDGSRTVSRFFSASGEFDVSDYLSTAYGFLPVPVIVTEPAVGFGGGVTLVYLHDQFIGKRGASGRRIPAGVSGVIAAGTENGTLFGGAFHLGYWMEDRLRTITFAGYPDVNIDTYLGDLPVSTNSKGPVFYQVFKGRLLDLDLFLGAGYLYTKIDTRLEGGRTAVPPRQRFTNAALDLLFEYDTRDNALSPNRGFFVNGRAMIFNRAVGSDLDFERYRLRGLLYLPLAERFNLDFDLTARSIRGDEAPFYAYPALDLRGMPALRYQGQHSLSIETQLSWRVARRWRLLVFGGLGKVFGSDQFGLGSVDFGDAPFHSAEGVGIRYLVAEKFGLRVGLDLAFSEEEIAFYIQFGSAWKGF